MLSTKRGTGLPLAPLRCRTVYASVSMRVAVFFPQNPFPSRSGAHSRCLSVLAALKDLGASTTLLSSSLTAGAQTRWVSSSVDALTGSLASDVLVHDPGPVDRRLVDWAKKWYQRRGEGLPALSGFHTPPGMRRWFGQQMDRIGPDVVIMNYAMFDGLIDHRRLRTVYRVMDSLDLVTLNRQMWQRVAAALPPKPIDVATVPDEVVDLRFFSKLDLRPDRREYGVFDQYDCTIAISRAEGDAISAGTTHTQVKVVPVTQAVPEITNTYTKPPVFCSGPNPFNIQGLLFFIKRVLPHVRALRPEFELTVTGFACEAVQPHPGIVPLGFVPSVEALYQDAAFAICPVFGLTGQQIKIVEAMAAGLPVVALKSAAASSPIRHGENGFIAQDHVEFAEYVLALWTDRALCRRLGHEARATVARECSPENLRQALESALLTR